MAGRSQAPRSRPGGTPEEPDPRPRGDAIFDSKGLAVERRTAGADVVYVFRGSCRASEPDFASLLDGLRRRMLSEELALVLDLHELDVANSLFVGLVAALVAHLDSRGRRLTVLGASRQVKDLLGIVGVLEALDLRDSLGSAEDGP